jgi:G3E family GTPase
MNRFVVANTRRQQIPLTIVGGPKGAGKTTLLRQLLTGSEGRRIAVAFDQGVVPSPSSAAVTNADVNALELATGGWCLAPDGDVGTALAALHSTRDRRLPDHVVVEASASASPLRMAGYTFLPGFRPGGMIVVVRASEIKWMCDEGTEPDVLFSDQLRHAELLLVNHMDELRAAARPAVRRWLQLRAGRARLIETDHCTVPLAMILGADHDHVPRNAIHGQWSPYFSVSAEAHQQRVVHPRNGDDYRSWLLSAEHPIDGRAFRDWARTLPDSVVRGDGVLRLLGEPSHQFRFECCGRRWSLSRGEPWGQDVNAKSWVSLVGFASRASSGKAPDEIRDSAGEAPAPKHHFQPPLWRSTSQQRFGDRA